MQSPKLNTFLPLLAAALLAVPSVTAAEAERTWTSADGRKLVGALLAHEGDRVTIRRDDGRRFDLALDQLSREDREFIAARAADATRRRGLVEGPYAEAVQSTWVKFPVDKHGLVYQLYIGEDLKSAKHEGALFPLFVHLHGAGARAGDVETGKVEIAATRLTAPEQYGKTPAIVCVPLCPPEAFWGAKTAELEAIIDDLAGSLPVDRDRIYLSGYSMGARGIASLQEALS